MNRAEHIQEVTRIARRYENKYFPLVQRAIKSQVDEVIAAVKRGGVHHGNTEAHKIVSSKIGTIIEALYKEVGIRFAKRQWSLFLEQKRGVKSMGPLEVKGFGFNDDWIRFIKDYLKNFLYSKILFEVSRYTRDVILTVLNKAVAEGWGVDETVRALDGLPLDRTQAARIVRTEITRAANTGTMAASSTFPFEQTKEWMSAHDMRTRGQHLGDHASHIGLDGRIVNEDEYFIDPINGDKLMFPGDPNATAASTINCRCSVAVVAKVDSNGRLIRKT